MWASQTYLGAVDPNSRVFLYYIWEDYAGQPDIPDAISQKLADLGYLFREKVSAYVPMKGYPGHIRNELTEDIRKFWVKNFSGKTPGLLFTTVSLRDFHPDQDQWTFFSLPQKVVDDERALTDLFQKLHEQCEGAINTPVKSSSGKSEIEAIYDAVQLRPSFMGIGVDLKPLISKGVQLGRRIRAGGRHTK